MSGYVKLGYVKQSISSEVKSAETQSKEIYPQSLAVQYLFSNLVQIKGPPRIQEQTDHILVQVRCAGAVRTRLLIQGRRFDWSNHHGQSQYLC